MFSLFFIISTIMTKVCLLLTMPAKIYVIKRDWKFMSNEFQAFEKYFFKCHIVNFSSRIFFGECLLKLHEGNWAKEFEFYMEDDIVCFFRIFYDKILVYGFE